MTFCCRIFAHFVLICMKFIKFWSVLQVVVAEAMLKAGYYWLEKFDMVELPLRKIHFSLSLYSFWLQKQMRNLFTSFWGQLRHHDTIHSTFEKTFSFSVLKKTKLRYNNFKRILFVDVSQKAIKHFKFGYIYFKHGLCFLDKLFVFLLEFVFLEADVAHAPLTFLGDFVLIS